MTRHFIKLSFLILTSFSLSSCISSWLEGSRSSKQRLNASSNQQCQSILGNSSYFVAKLKKKEGFDVVTPDIERATIVVDGVEKPNPRKGKIKNFHLNLQACIYDSEFPDVSILGGTPFEIHYYKNQSNRLENKSEVVKVVASPQGCIEWQETYDYKYVKQGYWIGLQRDIINKGQGGGQESVLVAVNPWLLEDEGQSPLLDMRCSYDGNDSIIQDEASYKPDGLAFLAEKQSHEKPLIWIGDFDIQIDEISPKANKEDAQKEEEIESAINKLKGCAKDTSSQIENTSKKSEIREVVNKFQGCVSNATTKSISKETEVIKVASQFQGCVIKTTEESVLQEQKLENIIDAFQICVKEATTISKEQEIRDIINRFQNCEANQTTECYQRTREMKFFIPLKERGWDTFGRIREKKLNGGSYNAKVQLFFKPQGQEDNKHYRIGDVCKTDNLSHKPGSEALIFTCDFNWTRFEGNATYYISIQLEDGEKNKESVKLLGFEGIYELGGLENLKTTRDTVHLNIGYDDFYAEALEENVPVKIIDGGDFGVEITDLEDIVSELESVGVDGTSNFKLSHVSQDSLAPCYGNENVIRRTAAFSGTVSLSDPLGSQTLAKGQFRVFLERPDIGRLKELDFKPKVDGIQPFVTDSQGKLTVPIRITHSIYDRQKYFKINLHFFNEAANLYGKTTIALSPWQRAFQAFQDAQNLDDEEPRYDAEKDNIEYPELIINQFRSTNIYPSYGLDKLLDIHLFHRVYFLFQPFVRRKDNISLGLDHRGRELLRDGPHLVRILILRNPQEAKIEDRADSMKEIWARKSQVHEGPGDLTGSRYITHFDSVVDVKADFVNFHMPLVLSTDQIYYVSSRNQIVIEIHPADPREFVYKLNKENQCEIDYEKTKWKPFIADELKNRPYVGVYNVHLWQNWNILQPVDTDSVNLDKLIDDTGYGQAFKHFDFHHAYNPENRSRARYQLIQERDNRDFYNKESSLELLKAIKEKKSDALDILEREKINLDINFRDTEAKTALHYAVENEDIPLVEELLKINGIDRSIRDIKMKTAKMYAEETGNEDLLALFGSEVSSDKNGLKVGKSDCEIDNSQTIKKQIRDNYDLDNHQEVIQGDLEYRQFESGIFDSNLSQIEKCESEQEKLSQEKREAELWSRMNRLKEVDEDILQAFSEKNSLKVIEIGAGSEEERTFLNDIKKASYKNSEGFVESFYNEETTQTIVSMSPYGWLYNEELLKPLSVQTSLDQIIEKFPEEERMIEYIDNLCDSAWPGVFDETWAVLSRKEERIAHANECKEMVIKAHLGQLNLSLQKSSPINMFAHFVRNRNLLVEASQDVIKACDQLSFSETEDKKIECVKKIQAYSLDILDHFQKNMEESQKDKNVTLMDTLYLLEIIFSFSSAEERRTEEERARLTISKLYREAHEGTSEYGFDERLSVYFSYPHLKKALEQFFSDKTEKDMISAFKRNPIALNPNMKELKKIADQVFKGDSRVNLGINTDGLVSTTIGLDEIERFIENGIRTERSSDDLAGKALQDAFASSLCHFWMDSYLPNYLEKDQMMQAYSDYMQKFDYQIIVEEDFSEDNKRFEYLEGLQKSLCQQKDDKGAECYSNFAYCNMKDFYNNKDYKFYDHISNISDTGLKSCSDILDEGSYEFDILSRGYESSSSCSDLLRKECETSGIALCTRDKYKGLWEEDGDRHDECDKEVQSFCFTNQDEKICYNYLNKCQSEYKACLEKDHAVDDFLFRKDNVLRTDKGSDFPPLASCLQNPYQFFNFENKMMVYELHEEAAEYRRGFARGVSMTSSHSVGSYMNWTAQRARSQSSSLSTSPKFGVDFLKKFISLTLLSLSRSYTPVDHSQNESNSSRRAKDAASRNSVFMSVATADIDIRVTKYQKCLVIKPRPHAFSSSIVDGLVSDPFTDTNVWTEEVTDNDQDFRRIMISKPGLTLCQPVMEDPNGTVISERYYFVTESIEQNNSKFLNFYDLANHPFVLFLRGGKEFYKFYRALQTCSRGECDSKIVKDINSPTQNMFIKAPTGFEDTVDFITELKGFKDTGFHPGVYDYSPGNELLDALAWKEIEGDGSLGPAEAFSNVLNTEYVPVWTHRKVPVQQTNR